MKIVKIIFITLSSLIICFLLFAFIASFSFENTFYNKKEDSTILFIKEKDKTSYKYSIKDKTILGNVILDTDKIVFVENNKQIATVDYDYNKKTISVTGKFFNHHYKGTKFKQITSIFDYLKVIF